MYPNRLIWHGPFHWAIGRNVARKADSVRFKDIYGMIFSEDRKVYGVILDDNMNHKFRSIDRFLAPTTLRIKSFTACRSNGTTAKPVYT